MAIDASDEIAYSQPGLHMSAELIGAATARSRLIVEFMRGCAAVLPDGVMRLLAGRRRCGTAALPRRCSCSTSVIG